MTVGCEVELCVFVGPEVGLNEGAEVVGAEVGLSVVGEAVSCVRVWTQSECDAEC